MVDGELRMNRVKGELFRNTRSGQTYIKVIFPNGDEDNLWDNIVEHCAKNLTDNELAKIFDDCNKQLLKTNPKDVPLTFKELMTELQQTIINRKVWKQ